MKKISVVIPARNEAETLPKVLSDLKTTISNLDGYSVDVICVDDHSSDDTPTIAKSFGVYVVQNTAKPGKGLALRTGFSQASGDILVMMDADYSHRPEDLPRFLEALSDDVGLVIGSRVYGGSDEYTHVRAFGNTFLSTVIGLTTGCHLSDALNGYKVFRREIFSDFKYTSTAFEIEVEIIANTLRKGYRVVEIRSHERARAGGEAKSFVVRHGSRFLMRAIWEGLRGVKPVNGS